MARTDPVGYDTDRYLNGLAQREAEGMEACVEAAKKAGHSRYDAENCDDGQWNCPECPWRKEPSG